MGLQPIGAVARLCLGVFQIRWYLSVMDGEMVPMQAQFLADAGLHAQIEFFEFCLGEKTEDVGGAVALPVGKISL